MFSSNQLFKVSGEDFDDELKQTLNLLYKLASYGTFNGAPESYEITAKGLVFYKFKSKGTPFITPPSVETLAGIVKDFLKEFNYNSISCYGGDGSNGKGWLVTNDYNDVEDCDAYFAIYAFWRYYAK